MQREFKRLPTKVNTDAALDDLRPDESPYMKGVEVGINANPNLHIGLDNPSGEGQNVETLTPTRSNVAFPGVILPAGTNKKVGGGESPSTKEYYYLNHNSNGNHGIYMLSGDQMKWYKVIEDPKLNFPEEQDGFVAEHRMSLRFILDKDKNIVEKILVFTNGINWQYWINVNAAINSDGFNDALYPYWKTKQPHFDREELFQWATRPPMINPVAKTVANTADDTGKVNLLIDRSFQFCQRIGNTDGRITVPGSYSDPIEVKSEDFLNNPNFLPKNSEITFCAGSPLTEYQDVFVRLSAEKSKVGVTTLTWSDWYWVERIWKFGHDPNVLTTEYWKRQNAWADYSYDPVFNTLVYRFDNSRLADIISQDEFKRLYNDIPQVSVAHAVLNDAAALANNRFDYDNSPSDIIKKISVVVKEKEDVKCQIETRSVKIYLYAGRDKGYGSTGGDDNTLGNADNVFISQFGYFNGAEDTQMRFGGIWLDSGVRYDIDESKNFKLDFADNESFRAYLKGTPYSAIGKWFVCDKDYNLTPVDGKLDATSASSKAFIDNVFHALSFFVCVFEFFVPAGKYIAAIGRHNVESSGDYRNQSTYIEGICDSRKSIIRSFGHEPFPPVTVRVIRPLDSIVSQSKEMEIDCTNSDFDPWGNGADIFYVNTPFIGNGRRSNAPGARHFRWQWIEGYLYDSPDSKTPVENYPYRRLHEVGQDGFITDKNGFFFAYTWGPDSDHETSPLILSPIMDCGQQKNLFVPNFNPGFNGWLPDNKVYVSDVNSGEFNAANRILLFGRITNVDGSVAYSNVGISIKDGATVYSDNDGRFVLVVHNGLSQKRQSNIVINSGGNFRISLDRCAPIPYYQFDENIVACTLNPSGNNPCTNEPLPARIYPTCLNVALKIDGGTDKSLKENATYSIGFACADLAGRLMAVNFIQKVTVPSYLSIGKVIATYFQMILSSSLDYMAANPDMKWFAPYVASQTNILKYIQWIGDKIEYVNDRGDIVNDPATAVLVKISIDSLYNYNKANNFSLLANWQFTSADRLRVMDDGEGNLLDVATYGEPIDVQILGTNYNDAVRNAGIISEENNLQINSIDSTSTPEGTNICFFVKYDARLDKLSKKTGFWIELATPFRQTEKVPYSELKWYPLINGNVAEFIGFNGASPLYNFPLMLNLTYWDTYLFTRAIAIPGVGSKYFDHAFCSPNVSDSWGYHLTSGGRNNFRNDNAKQHWRTASVTKSNVFDGIGIINGIGTFLGGDNLIDYGNTQFAGIIGIVFGRGVGVIVCENDWFVVNYDFHYAFPNEQGLIVVNPNSGLTRPTPKKDSVFGILPEDTGTLFMSDGYVFWYDRKNEAIVMCDFGQASDISDIQDKDGRSYGINSWITEKTSFISQWNSIHKTNSRFDVIAGVDIRTKRAYFTFRPRQLNSNDPKTFVNRRRNIAIKGPETVCFDYDQKRWVAGPNWTPEGYGKLRGAASGVEMLTFAAGKPYYHLNTPNDNFLNFYGVQTESVIAVCFNDEKDVVKTLQSMSQNILPNALRIDLVYDNEPYSFSFLPSNYIKKKENSFYGSFLTDMVSYLEVKKGQDYRSTLHDGKRLFGRYFVVRFVVQPGKESEYFQLSEVFQLNTDSPLNKK